MSTPAGLHHTTEGRKGEREGGKESDTGAGSWDEGRKGFLWEGKQGHIGFNNRYLSQIVKWFPRE